MRQIDDTLEELINRKETLKTAEDCTHLRGVDIDDVLIVILQRFQEVEQECKSLHSEIYAIQDQLELYSPKGK